ncbi:MAG: UDP-N-acetylmuramoyl-tripeptide--D-alanyl-D-alanine ligase [Candidatus Paceibacterota bacterium]
MKSLLKGAIVSILTFEARLLLRRTKPTIIAITGSVGKTTTKDAIYAVLKDRRSARKSEKSYNSELGVPLTILGLENAWSNPFQWVKNIFDGLLVALMPHEYPEVLVLEMGVDRPGDMQRFTRWIKPDIVVLTRLPDVPVHVEYFDSPEAVTEEKLTLVQALKPDGVLVYNNDDEQIRKFVEGVTYKTIGYSRYSPTDFAATQDVVRYEDGSPVGLSFTLSHKHEAVTVELDGCIGVQHTYCAAAAASVGSLFGLSIEDVVAALKGYVPPPGRMRLLPGIKETLVIDDSYNSSPVAMERALLTLKEIRGAKRRIAVLGDMLELGRFSSEAHQEAGKQVANTAQILVTVGIRSRVIADSALHHGMNKESVFQYDDAQTAVRELSGILADGDVVLVKGSQSIRLERVVEGIMAEPKRASELLVRQSRAWRDK